MTNRDMAETPNLRWKSTTRDSGPLDSKSLMVLIDRGVVSAVDLASSSSHGGSIVAGTSGGEEAALDLESKKIVKRKQKKTKIEKITITENGEKAEMIEKVQKVEEAMMAKATEAIESLDPNTWGSRYFHPPDGGWETCYNCGEEGHIAVNCKSASTWKKPCFVCGSLDHGARQCSKNCFICKKCGHHHVKGCPDKYKSSSNPGNICLRCGVSGYDMFSCRNDYSQDDIKVSSCSLVFLIIVFSIAFALSFFMVFVLLTVLLMFFLPNQEIQCYICKSFGHICCINFVDTSPREVSCYRCGQLGHTGLFPKGLKISFTSIHSYESVSLHNLVGLSITLKFTYLLTSSMSILVQNSIFMQSYGGSLGETKETTDNRSPSLCYKCGEGGHFAHECTTGTASSSLYYKCGGGHFARQCTTGAASSLCYKCGEGEHSIHECSSAMLNFSLLNRESSTPNLRSRLENKDLLGYKSVPHDNGKSRCKRRKNPVLNRQNQRIHRFSASRFSNLGNDEPRRTCNWW
ncbi:hypothetical protein ES288_A13G109300v1 [Gossypium darwinii]|uniref:CCHC-type domain-containing protein n=1 Tax=Gossypium darwinii TaxID=34276 RepID=A0A5D2DYI2_GOSDA|nr:hypothetical protein ES288_A13G109300v1 [Gossypium darwinii]